jgi:hypothetical protein
LSPVTSGSASGSKYAVRVDGKEVGRLGRRSKSVRANVERGSHSVVVQYNGNQTPAEQLDVAGTGEVRLTLVFGSASALATKYDILTPGAPHLATDRSFAAFHRPQHCSGEQ